MKQLTNTVLMIEPSHFGFNPETALTNSFQHHLSGPETETAEKALVEFRAMVAVLRESGIRVLVLKSRIDVVTPDSIFPNNWFSHFVSGELIIYPMLTPNRRAERQVDKLKTLLVAENIPVSEVIDLSGDETSGQILEGTGSLVLDRVKKIAFAMCSPRTTRKEFEKWCKITGYKGVLFNAYDAKNFPIYHTNVLMNIGQNFVIICLESIKSPEERELVENTLRAAGKEIVEITIAQMDQFCGNVLEVLADDGTSRIVMSKTAHGGFSQQQLATLRKYGKIVAVEIPTIETIGGGSARCMMAEVFPNK